MSPLAGLLVVLIAATSVAIVSLLLFVSLRLLVGALEDARLRAFERRWEPVLLAWMDGEHPSLPALPEHHRLWLLRLWNRTRSFVEGESANFLRQLALVLELPRYSAELLGARAAWKRILGVLTLGELGSVAYWKDLQALLDEPRPPVALAAVEAMVRIDPSRAAPRVVPALLARSHWDPVRVGRLLRTLGPAAVGPLLTALEQTPPGAAARVLAWLGLTQQHEVLPPLRARLAAGDSAEEAGVILKVLGQLGGAEDRTLALPYLVHAEWHVRMHAATALGQIGLTGDRQRLAKLLTDPAWWVRYRAAGALFQLRGVTPEHFRALAARHPNPQARDVLQRILAERAS